MHSRRFWITHAALPLLAFSLLVWLFQVTDLDYALSDPFYDFEAGGWTFRESWWARILIHNIGRWLVMITGLVALGIVYRGRSNPRLRPWRQRALYFALVILVSTVGVQVWQLWSPQYCPREVTRYGGEEPHLSLLELPPEGVPRGHCFPSKHSAFGFSLLSLYFLFRDLDRRRALAGLACGLIVGTVFSFGQVVRGSHFTSHNLWTGALCWVVALGLYAWMLRGESGSRESHPPTPSLPTLSSGSGAEDPGPPGWA